MAAITSVFAGMVALAATASAVQARKQRKIAKRAQESQKKELKRQAGIREKADLKVSEAKAREDAKSNERRARLSKSRKGLLFQDNEQGVVDDDTLGG